MTDESVAGFTERLDKVFGGRILKDAPTDRKARDLYMSRLGQNLNALEGKFEMMSLLFHPKTFLTNLYGGFSNTITDVGLKPDMSNQNTPTRFKKGGSVGYTQRWKKARGKR